MSEVSFADILLILLICCVIYVILYLVNRNKGKDLQTDQSSTASGSDNVNAEDV